MATDRTVRSLSALSGASSSRVLNLLAIGLTQAENEGHRNAPLFGSFIINNSIILKHRLRADEVDLFPVRRVLATKVIIPFERSDLKVGACLRVDDVRSSDIREGLRCRDSISTEFARRIAVQVQCADLDIPVV